MLQKDISKKCYISFNKHKYINLPTQLFFYNTVFNINIPTNSVYVY